MVQNCPETRKKEISGIKAHLVTGHIKLPKSNLESKLQFYSNIVKRKSSNLVCRKKC
jgi:hypothetical protein